MKFFNLLKKELSEIINAQMILTLVIYLVMLLTLGKVMNATVEDTIKQEYTVNISDRDNTDFTHALIESLRKSGAEISEFTTDGDDYASVLDSTGKKSIVIIPEGFTEKIENGESPELISVAGMESASLMSNTGNNNSGAIGLISACISNVFAEKSGLTAEDINLINSPVSVSEHTVVQDKSAEASTDSLVSQLMMQNMLLPIVVFLLIMTTSQTLMSAISNEKIDKTLETLLSAPVARTSILGAKMLAAAIVALLNAVVMMIGFSSFTAGAAASLESEMSGTLASQFISVDEAMEKLGLNLGVGDFILVGIQFFMTIMICLSISIMLGALVNDSKQAQTMIMPLMIAAVIPYMVSMITDINTLPLVYKIIVYAIPFTHTFSSITNIMFGNMGIFWGGLAYQTVFFIVCMFFALKLFKSDKILTASLNLGQKLRFKSKK
ncbi:MAG: ABC transporter permease [Ruminococcus flavefaciens]|nr:ABC transporter permease [Ruminococcus flavefaciens]MCM1228511.1 ABC transporter permease [Ruminococcus flavefaciens]